MVLSPPNSNPKSDLLKVMKRNDFLPSSKGRINILGTTAPELAEGSPPFAIRFLDLGIKYLRIPNDRNDIIDSDLFSATARTSYSSLDQNKNIGELIEALAQEKVKLGPEDLDIAVMMAISLNKDMPVPELPPKISIL